MRIAKDQDKSRRIDEERVCIDALGYVLRERCSCREFRPHEEANDPPDFTVIIDGEVFPAEVTSIVSSQEHYAQCRQFAKVLRDRAAGDGVLVGTYAVCISEQPRVPKASSQGGRSVIDLAADHIAATRQEGINDEIELVRDSGGRIQLRKVADTGATVGVYWEPVIMWEGETQGELATLLQRAIREKINKLQNVGVGPGRALLLLYDAYGRGDIEDACIALDRVEGFDWFHSIFWAASFTNRTNSLFPNEPGREGAFLYSRVPTWHRVGV